MRGREQLRAFAPVRVRAPRVTRRRRRPSRLHPGSRVQAALFESARDDMRRAHLAAQADQLQQVADDATVDQFIRHAESGFFGGDEEADFVWDGDY